MIIIESLQRGQKRKGMQLNKTKMVVVVDVEEECGCGGSFEDCGACGRRVLEVTAAANNGFYVRRELSVMIVVMEEGGGRWREVCCHGCLSSTVTRHHLLRGWC